MITNEFRDNNWCYDENCIRKDKTHGLNIINPFEPLTISATIVFHIQKNENEFYI